MARASPVVRREGFMCGKVRALLRVEEAGARRLRARRIDAEVFVGEARGGAPARRAVEEADLDEVGLDDLLDGVLLLLQRGRHVVESDGAALVLLDDHQQKLPVHLVEPERVHLHAVQRSEEHTSELQSRQYLVCRLLLEKKKKNK